MSLLIFIPLEGKVKIMDEDGNLVTLTCVENNTEAGGCNGCFFKRAPGKPQYEFCQAVACGDFERMDSRDVIFQKIKVKDND